MKNHKEFPYYRNVSKGPFTRGGTEKRVHLFQFNQIYILSCQLNIKVLEEKIIVIKNLYGIR